MAKIFLDANIFIDIVEKRGDIELDEFKGHDIFVSPLSLHILLYIMKQKIPYKKLSLLIDSFSVVALDESVTNLSTVGPTSDFEDNVQLHSATEAECDYFLTHDQKLLDLKFFGKTRLVTNL